jgi:hypothetical protein
VTNFFYSVKLLFREDSDGNTHKKHGERGEKNKVQMKNIELKGKRVL